MFKNMNHIRMLLWITSSTLWWVWRMSHLDAPADGWRRWYRGHSCNNYTLLRKTVKKPQMLCSVKPKSWIKCLTNQIFLESINWTHSTSLQCTIKRTYINLLSPWCLTKVRFCVAGILKDNWCFLKLSPSTVAWSSYDKHLNFMQQSFWSYDFH